MIYFALSLSQRSPRQAPSAPSRALQLPRVGVDGGHSRRGGSSGYLACQAIRAGLGVADDVKLVPGHCHPILVCMPCSQIRPDTLMIMCEANGQI